MRHIYEILNRIEARPAMYLGDDCKIKSLSDFYMGFIYGGGKTYDKTLNCPDFNLFTNWVGGILKFNCEGSSTTWSGLLLEKFKDNKIALDKFFYYLKQFKTSEPEVILVPLKKVHIEYAIQKKEGLLWLRVGNRSKTYYTNLKKVDTLVLYKLKPSRALFCLVLDKKGKIMDDRNNDIADKTVRRKIEKQFGIDLSTFKPIKSADSRTILRHHKLI